MFWPWVAIGWTDSVKRQEPGDNHVLVDCGGDAARVAPASGGAGKAVRPTMRRRAAATVQAMWLEWRGAWRLGDDLPSILRLSADVVLYRVLRITRLPNEGRPRSIRLRSAQQVTYRLNRGDIQSVREVLYDEAYRLPFPIDPCAVVVDLGANIGLTSLYYTHRLAPDRLVAVEADERNAELLRRNLAPFGHSVVHAAVGPEDGTAHFARNRDSNLGTTTGPCEGAVEVPMVSIATLLRAHDITTVDLMKMDIEGGEQALLEGDLEWLSQVRAIIAEFHPEVVDYEALVQRLIAHGFRYVAAGTAWPNQMDAFVRDRPSA